MRKKLLLTFTLFLVLLGSVFAQERTITGRVTSAEDGTPMPGVNIIVAGTTNVGTISDVYGRYSIKVPAGNNVLEFSFVGMKTQSVEIGASDVVDAVMETSAEMIGGY